MSQDHEKDAFWDLESLLPAKKRPTAAPRVERDTDAVEVSAPAVPRESSTFADTLFTEHFVPPHTARELKPQAPLFSYQPQGSLLHEIRVYAWRISYDYYEAFCEHAQALLGREGRECPPVEFFSYVPQYSQMNTAQLEYYLWWRTQFKKGECLPVSFSYLLLFLYEIINLGDKLSPAEGQRDMLRLWLSYRKAHPRLDALVREWLCDYSLLYRLPAPVLPRGEYRDLLSGARLKEFYVPLAEDGNALTDAVLTFCNNYDYTKSKFYTTESAGDYHRILRGAVGEALCYLRERAGDSLMGGKGKSTISRDAFTGALCSCRQKRRIEVDYTSFSHTHELRYIMSDVLKYAENALRAAKGVRSRLSIYAVDVPLRERLDAYFVRILPTRITKNTKKEEMPGYERRYELPVVTPSPQRAAEIEAASWQTTKRLVEAFEGREEEPDVQDEAKMPPNGSMLSANGAPTAVTDTDLETGTAFAAALGPLVEFFALSDAASQRAFAAAQGLMLDAVVDKINTVSGDMLGDILLEEGDNGAFVIIEDYRDWLKEQGVE